MTCRRFSLKPFRAGGPASDLNITGNISRGAAALSLSVTLRGPLAEVALPPSSELPARKTALWEETCFEIFLGTNDSDRYWEFNLSPGGHWNVYRFTSYRQGMREERAFTSLPFRVLLFPDALRLFLKTDLERIIPSGQAVEVAISSVVKTVGGKTSFWALTHPGAHPDFHRREGFLIKLQGADIQMARDTARGGINTFSRNRYKGGTGTSGRNRCRTRR
jgi:hypothetical protein